MSISYMAITFYNKIVKLSCYAIMAIAISSCGIINSGLPEFQDDSNVFGMYLDSQRWVPNAFSNFSKDAHYYPSVKTLRITAVNTFFGERARFYFYISNMSGIGNYQASLFWDVVTNPDCEYRTSYDPNDKCTDEFKLLNPNDSFIEIVEFDTIGFRVSGYFDMVLVNELGDKIKITGGRFSLDTNQFGI